MNGRMRTIAITLFLSLLLPPSLRAADVRIDKPREGFTSKRIQTISGTINDFTGSRATVIINGIPQTIPVSGGRFSMNAVVSPGLNVIEVIAGGARDRISFYAKVPKRDIKVVLTWDTATDVDLWVIDPKGEKCYYSHTSTKSGGNLDVDVISGYGPETFTMAQALPGSYSVQVQYYSSNESPVTRVKLYVVLYEGTPREEIKKFSFIMTREHLVYHIADFSIEGE